MTEELEAEKPAEKSINDLLGDYQKPEPDSRIDNVVSFVEDFKQKQEEKSVTDGVSEAVEFFKADESITASDRLVKGFINAYADENPDAIKAFANRESNPKEWQSHLDLAREEMKSEFSTDTKITDAVSAAKASASGQITEEPAPKKITSAQISGLNDFQFKEYKRLLGNKTTQEEAFKAVK